MEGDIHGSGVLEDHMLLWNVAGKEMCYCMMWVSFAIDGNKQVGKWLVLECKALNGLKWIMPSEGITLTSHHGGWYDYDITFTITMTVKQMKFKCIKCTNKGDELYYVPICYMKFLKYDHSWHWIGGVCHV
jgi:hypothetical protein